MLCGDLNASDSNRDAAIEIMYDNTRHAEVRETPYICSDITNLCATDTLWSVQSLAQKGRTGYVMARSFTRTSGMPRASPRLSNSHLSRCYNTPAGVRKHYHCKKEMGTSEVQEGDQKAH